MKKLLLHLSNTDIRCDSRILKELRALEKFVDYERLAIGVDTSEGSPPDFKPIKAHIESVRLFTNISSRFPRSIRYTLNIFELTLILFVRGLMARPSAVHCHDTFVLPAGVLIQLVTNCKLIYDAHELESSKNAQSCILARSTLLIEKLSWSRVDLLISVSESILYWYDKHLGPKKSILVLNSPYAGNSYSKPVLTGARKKYFHRLYGIPEDKIIFVYIGILGPGRGLELALDAFSTSFPDPHLILVGYGEFYSYIESVCSTHQNIHLHNPVPHDEVVELVASADFGLCLIENISLSDYYCLPNKLFEYSFAGLRILASDFPEIKKVVTRYKLGVCCSLDPPSVRRAIQSLIENPPQSTSIDISDLSWELQAKRLVDGYRTLLDLPA